MAFSPHGDRHADTDSFLSACTVFTTEVSGKILRGCRCRYHVAAYRDSLFDDFGIEFPRQLDNAVAKRRSDYLAGRYCAQSVLKQLNCVVTRVPIGSNREPIWPEGVVASLSHSADLAVCIATTDSDVLALGIDVEKEMTSELASDIRQQIVDVGEEAVIRSQFPTFNQGLTVVFSAKESIYKALYRFVGRFFEYSAMRLVRVNPDQMAFSVVKPLSEQFHAGVEITVNYRITDSGIQTLACLLRPSAVQR